MSRKILLFGLFGCGNSGNDASLEAALDMLRRVAPQAEPVCITPAPDAVTRRYGIAAAAIGTRVYETGPLRLLDRLLGGLPRRLGNVVRAARLARQADALVFPGTGILDDFGTGPFGSPVAIFGWCLGARAGGARVAFVSVGAGPAEHPLSRRLFAWAARLAHYRSYRDAVSRDFLARAGVDVRRDGVFPDLVFGLPVPPVRSRPAGPLRVGVGVMGYYGWKHHATAGHEIHRAYIDKMRRFVLWLLDAGHDVCLLTGDVGDEAALATLAAAVRQARPGLRPGRLGEAPTADLRALMAVMADLDLVVGTRFHNMVAALKLGLPAISIGYADKNDALLADVGLGEFCQHIETFDIDRLQQQVAALVAAREDRAATVAEAVADLRRRLREQECMLATWLATAAPATAPERSGLGRPVSLD